MKFEMNEKPKTYAVSGNELRINFDVKETQREDLAGNTRTVYTGEEVLVELGAKSNFVIEAIVASRYSFGAEIAMMRKPDTDPEKIAYLDFVKVAKSLAKNAPKA